MLDFFSLGETFLGIGMRLGGGIMQFKMFGNLAHPNVAFCFNCQMTMWANKEWSNGPQPCKMMTLIVIWQLKDP